MNTKNNRRRRASVAIIGRSFMELLQTRELNEVTVSDICARSGLNRSTFYANFTDIYDLADRLREHLEAEVGQLYQTDRDASRSSNDYLRLFRHIRENQLFYTTYFKLGYDSRHPALLYDTTQALRYLEGRHIDYHIESFRGGFNAVVKRWLSGRCRETPEEMEEILRSEYQGRG